METPDEIWEGDLFDRRNEAEQLIGFIETVTMRPSLREDGHAFVLAVDAPYGEGKSYFLRRFARHMAQTHPVAFVDAWVDDLENEPLVALAATLDAALAPHAEKAPELQLRIDAFKKKAGAVAKIISVGLLKRAASFVIMESGAEAVGKVIGNTSDLTADLGTDVLKKAADGVVDDAMGTLSAIVSGPMTDRIHRFREGQAGIKDMKTSLRAIVEYLGQEQIYPPPVTIVIDELDRCRPDYAIKLLEEVKHLFDVEGVAFVLGLHGNALAHSVTAAYGASFDGNAYLQRFFNRRYSLKPARLESLVQQLFTGRALDVARLACPMIAASGSMPREVSAPDYVGLSMRAYGLNARSAFQVIDMLETCLALTAQTTLLLPYLLPLIFNHVRGKEGMAEPLEGLNWVAVTGQGYRSTPTEWSIGTLARGYANAATLSDNDLMDQINRDNAPHPVREVGQRTLGNQGASLNVPRNYVRLLETVGRFVYPTGPAQGDPAEA